MNERIEALERSNRQLRFAVIVLFALTSARLIVPATAQSASQTFDLVRAQRVEIYNSSGKTVATLLAANGGGSFDIRNNAGRSVAIIDAREQGSKVSLGAGGDDARFILDSSPSSATLQMGTDGSSRVEITAERTSGGGLQLKTGNGSDGIWMRGNEPSINMMDGCIHVLSLRGMKFTTCQ